MSRDGNGNYVLPSGNPVTTNTPISSTVQNNTMNDVAAALTASLAKDGQTVPTNNLPMGGYRHTGASNGVAATDYATLGQLAASTGSGLMGFIQSGLGAIAETLLVALGRAYHVAQFDTPAHAVIAAAGKRLYINNGQTVTLNVPADFATIQAALDAISDWVISAGGTVTIQVADGTYVMPAVLNFAHPYGSKIAILGNTATPANCLLQYASSDGMYVPKGFKIGTVNGFRLVKTGAKSNLGVLTDGGEFLKLGPKIEVDNFYYGISARNFGTIHAGGNSSSFVKVTNAGDAAIWAFIGSNIVCDYAEVSGTNDSANGLGGGIVAEFGSSIQANFVNVHDNWLCGISSISNSAIRAWSCNSHDSQHGLITGSGGRIEVFGTPATTIQNNTGYGTYCPDGDGLVYGLASATVSGNTLGATYSRFEFKADGSMSVRSGSVTIDATQPGSAVGASPYLDMNAAAGSNYAIIRALLAGVEAARIQFNHAASTWELVNGGNVQASVQTNGFSVNGASRINGNSGDAYHEIYAPTGHYCIQRYLINNVEQARTQYDGVNGVFTIGGNSKTAFRFYPASGKTTAGVGAPATNATTGHLQIPVQAGTPTGAVSDVSAGFVPLVADSTNNKLWVFINGAWKSAALA